MPDIAHCELLVPHHGSLVTERVTAIEYLGTKPFAVTTQETRDNSDKAWLKPGENPLSTTCNHYDFEWCKTNRQLYYSMSGCGGDSNRFVISGAFCKPLPPPAKLWLAPGVRAVRQTGKSERVVSDAALLKLGYLRIVKPLLLGRLLGNARTRNPFEAAEESECEYCKFCKDYLPTSDGDGDWICDHVRWCDECGWWVYDIDGACVSTDSSDETPVRHEGQGGTHAN